MSKNKAFSLSEVILIISIIGILAVTMLSLNKFSNYNEKVILIKMAQVESALQSWGKSLNKSNETGLGIGSIIWNQQTLESSLLKKFTTKRLLPKQQP